MAKRIAIVNGNKSECSELCTGLHTHLFQATCFSSLVHFDRAARDFEAVIFDLASLPVTNQLLKEYSKNRPDLHMIAISGRSFHPELRESMATCLAACLKKPVDLDELIYLLRGL